MANGYIRVRVEGRWIYEHRHVMESNLGRALNSREVVHHINGDRTDNHIENLAVMTKSEHDRIGTARRWARGEMAIQDPRRERCGEPCIDRHHRGKSCERLVPCPFHAAGARGQR
jgi:hypothetical protein